MRNSFSVILPRIMTRMVLRWLLGELVEICMSVVSRTYIRNGEHYECHQRNGYTFLDTNFRLCRPRFLHRPKSAVAQLTLFTPPLSGNLCSGSVVWRFFGRNLRNFQSVLHIIVHEINREEKVQLPCCTVCLALALVQPTNRADQLKH